MVADEKERGLSVAWLIAITAAAAVLRLAWVDVAILGDDEVHMLTVVSTRSLVQIPGTVIGYDFSIPMALLFRLWSAWTPLTELMLRTPTLLAGCALPVVAACLARRFVSAQAALLTAMAVAVHPLFVFYARYVRPYEICVLLLLLAIRQLDRHARDRRRGALGLAAVLGALACWFQPIAIITAGLAFGGLLAAEWWTDRARALRVVLAGTCLLALTLLLYAPALQALIARMVVQKIGQDTVTLDAVHRNAAVLAGWPGPWCALAGLVLAVAGAVRLLRREGRRALMLVVPVSGLPVVIAALQPDSISRYQVLARYLLYALPLVLIFGADALCAATAWLARRMAPAVAASRHADTAARCGGALLASAWVVFGPLPTIYGPHTAFAHHNTYQTYLHLTDARLEAARRRGADPPVHPWYVDMARAEPPVPLVIEWPAAIDYPHNYFIYSQAFHRRPLALLATEGEPWYVGARLALKHVVTLDELAHGDVPPGAFVVMHRNQMVEAARYVFGQIGWLSAGAEYERSFVIVRRALEALLGPPDFEDRFLTVFRVSKRE